MSSLHYNFDTLSCTSYLTKTCTEPLLLDGLLDGWNGVLCVGGYVWHILWPSPWSTVCMHACGNRRTTNTYTITFTLLRVSHPVTSSYGERMHGQYQNGLVIVIVRISVHVCVCILHVSNTFLFGGEFLARYSWRSCVSFATRMFSRCLLAYQVLGVGSDVRYIHCTC